jgi:hypothetical protein
MATPGTAVDWSELVVHFGWLQDWRKAMTNALRTFDKHQYFAVLMDLERY